MAAARRPPGSRHLLRRPLFWLPLALVSLGLSVFTFLMFPRAMPLVTLDLRMDRTGALQAARELAARHGWGPAGYRQAVRFTRDGEVQSFVELEGGGAAAFRQLIRDPLYAPYAWEVRHFRPEDADETRVFFAPDGRPLGFTEKIPETRSAPNLDKAAARDLAQREAGTAWGIDLAPYELVEDSQETRPNGRVDHTFVYQLPDRRLGEGRFRLKLVVTGDRLTQVDPFVRIPEAFTLRYRQMRSANETLSEAAGIVAVLLYGIGGVLGGLLFLLRQRWVLWRMPLVLGALLAAGTVLSRLNQWPLLWMDYDTAVSASGFVMAQVARMILSFVGMGVVATLLLMAAESLSRRAFPHHLRLWRIAAPGVANSPPVLGRALGAYAAASIGLAYVVGVYLVGNAWWHWWSPSDTLVDPDVLAHYAPWFSPLLNALSAGALEESLFRAVPLSVAALIGRRFRREGAWIVGTLIVQAIVFGTAHANYATQPAYARAIEMFLPALVWGVLYLRFGLLLTILTHAGYDFVLMSTPLFASAAPGSLLNQGVIVALGLTPLGVVLYRRLRAARWVEPPPEAYNRAFLPAPPPEPAAWHSEGREGRDSAPLAGAGRGVSPLTAGLVALAGVLGVLAWALTADFHTPLPPVALSRADAVAAAQTALSARSVSLAAPWRPLPSLDVVQPGQHQYVWRAGGAAAYARLLGTYLQPALWRVRFARFEGELVQRAEEYRVYLTGAGEAVRVVHALPETVPGARIDREQARRLALDALQRHYGMGPAAVREVSVEPRELPARRDWIFAFAVPEPMPTPGGEARIHVAIAGDQVSDIYRTVHIPEAWQRAEESRRNGMAVLRIVAIALLVVGLVAIVLIAALGWARGQFSLRVAGAAFAVFFALLGLLQVNAWPDRVADFSTAQPLSHQVFSAVSSALVKVLLLSGLFALLAGFLREWTPRSARAGIKGGLLGAALGALVAGANALVTRFSPTLLPPWPDLGFANHWLPWASVLIERADRLLLLTLFAVLIVASCERFTAGWSRRRGWAALLFVLLGYVLATLLAGDLLRTWLATWIEITVLAFLLVRFVLRYHIAMAASLVATLLALSSLREGLLHGRPSAGVEAALGISLLALLGGGLTVWIDRALSDRPGRTAARWR